MDPNRRTSATYNYTITFWDGDVRTGTMTSIGGGTYRISVTKNISASVPGRNAVSFKATDGAKTSVVEQTLFLVENHVPVIDKLSASSLGAVAGSSVTFKVEAHDPDGDALTYRWEISSGQILTTPEITVPTSEQFTTTLVGTGTTAT